MKTEVLKTYQDFKEFHSKVKKKKKSQTVTVIVFLITFRCPIESSQEIVDNLHCYVFLLINETVVLIRVFTLFVQFITLVKFLWLKTEGYCSTCINIKQQTFFFFSSEVLICFVK